MELTFEQKMAKLEELTKKLEDDKIGLEESVKIFNEAKALSKELNDQLNQSMEKLSYIVEDGKISVFDVEEDSKKDI